MARLIPDAGLQAGLSYLFSFFESRHHLHKGRYDREVRQPAVFLDIAMRHAVLPHPECTIVVTGSKGKGSCARLTVAYLQRQGYRVGLVLTPEERSHLDRIRISDNPIGVNDFLRLLETLKPDLESAMHQAGDLFYHPPTSIFLLVALKYFREQQVDYVVVEGGRGAQFDEIGQLNAAVGIVTSIFPEHLSRLGPDLRDICIDKFSLTRSCRAVICSEQAWQKAQQYAPGVIAAEALEVVPQSVGTGDRPAWVGTADSLARLTMTKLGKASDPELMTSWSLPSCEVITSEHSPCMNGDQCVILDGAVSADCLDLTYIASENCMPGGFILAMTADKDVAGIVKTLQNHFGLPVYFFRPVSRSGHVAAPAGIEEWAGSFDVERGIDEDSRRNLLGLLDRHSRLYVIGVQLFLRSVRNALKL